MNHLRSPIFWYGGKGKMTATLLLLLPRCHTYVEPFGGGASLLFGKKPSPVEVYNDVDEGLVGFFRVLADPELFEQFYRRVALLPYARAIYNECRKTWREQTDPALRAAQWFIVARQSFGGHFGHSWGSAVTSSSCGMAATCANWLSAIERLPQCHARLQRVQIEQSDWRVILERYDTPATLFYCDPTYAHGTRSNERYAHELTDKDHRDLIERMLSIQGGALLSGYDTPMYQPLTGAGWQRYQWDTACHAAAKTRATGLQGAGAALNHQARTEAAWLKAPPAGDSQLKLW